MAKTKSIPNPSLSVQIRKRRTDLGMSTSELGEEVHVSRKTIEAWESPKNNRTPSLDVLKDLCSIFGCTLSDLLGEDSAIQICNQIQSATDSSIKNDPFISYLQSIGHSVQIVPYNYHSMKIDFPEGFVYEIDSNTETELFFYEDQWNNLQKAIKSTVNVLLENLSGK